MSGSRVIGTPLLAVRWALTGAMLFGGMTAAGDEEDFLDTLQADAARVEGPLGAAPVPAMPVSVEDRRRARKAFEAALEENNRGTWLFYRRLPRRYRDEVFEDHLRGASTAKIRTKILQRYLHGR